ncbi:YczE/YyaS/YitT family protein [Cellulosilyticum ruminicola]|uniref:YczE/YyaS/YitT family protein n=1 Tax=Cellulosilyticum ruminicola TaxID=425254 RepID=UPI0006D218CF|nr:YitT family protein [Cellulosilyticum ruminicola]
MDKQIKGKRVLFGVGICVLTFGSRMLLLADIGIGGIDSVVVGLAKIFGGSFGLWIDIVSLTLIIIGAVLRKRIPQWQPIITSLLLGLVYDVWGIILFNKLVVPQDEFIQGLIFLAGILIAPLGTAIYLSAHISTSCVDYLMLSINERLHLSIGVSRNVIEAVFVITGYIVGGPIGVGTIMIMLLYGAILQNYYRIVEGFLKRNNKRMHKLKNRRQHT